MQACVALFDLQQYACGRLPGTATAKPTEARNVRSQQPAHGPTDATTYGFANALRMAHGMLARDSAHAINSMKGIMGFYTSGKESVSDNGVTDAQRFFELVRPLEGQPLRGQVNARTVVGGKFPAPSIAL
jgi:hypothetical protein